MKKVNDKTVINSASATCSAQSTNNYMQYPKYRNKQGHGWAAEDANAMADRLSGKKVERLVVTTALTVQIALAMVSKFRRSIVLPHLRL